MTDFVWQMKNRPKGVIEYKSTKLVNGVKWDGKDVELVEEEELDEEMMNQILNDTKKNELWYKLMIQHKCF